MKRQRQEKKRGFLSISYLLIVLMIAALTACGGGSSNSNSSSNNNNNNNSTGVVEGFTSLAIDSSGRIHISYLSSINAATNGSLKYATNASGAWVATTME